ncbi:LuxR C-terminal-related transcriptional regulator [Serratia fonticola]|uniref:LuxR C-terminal-related transcriptional regulator n=1 Tax=Serratia fonticola TaxID=47917 RepID=UPI001377D63A|nr:LuxR C-terminal-related transcriptional regulator [Serratia fonticola]NCG51956.1 hypothetical protein [Serratia fonticola]
MNKQNILVHSSCQYTRLGLEYAISSHPKLTQQTNLTSYSTTSGFLPSSNFAPDVLILVPDMNIAEVLTTPLPKKTKVVIISSRRTPDWMIRNYFSGRISMYRLNITVSVSEFQALLVDLLGHQQTQNHCDDIIYLSQREQDIIRRLLNGKNATRIAQELGLSCKTVSAHKRRALLKLGVHSLHGLLACPVTPHQAIID